MEGHGSHSDSNWEAELPEEKRESGFLIEKNEQLRINTGL